jgi:cytochrome c biogenesis protein ResB
MRWLMVVLIVSLVGLLIAAAALARHIWLQHARARPLPEAVSGKAPGSGPAAGTDVETEI